VLVLETTDKADLIQKAPPELDVGTAAERARSMSDGTNWVVLH